jgi:hypothetical protein
MTFSVLPINGFCRLVCFKLHLMSQVFSQL